MHRYPRYSITEKNCFVKREKKKSNGLKKYDLPFNFD